MKKYEEFFLTKNETDPTKALAAAEAVEDYISHSTAGGRDGDIVHRVHPLLIPKIFSAGDLSVFKNLVDTLYGICAKVIRLYQEDDNIRKLFDFSELEEELIMLRRGYQCPLPIARFDIFYDEETQGFTFCELNTDGTSAMNENRELINSLEYNLLYQDYIYQENIDFKAPQSFELFDTWIDTFINIYEDFTAAAGSTDGTSTVENSDGTSMVESSDGASTVESSDGTSTAGSPDGVEAIGSTDGAGIGKAFPQQPNIVITDFIEDAYLEDFEEFCRRFTARGYRCEICDIRKLSYKNGRLMTPSGMEVHAIYRRAVTTDVVSKIDEIGDFIEAVKAGAVCLIGSFATQVIHNKSLFILLRNPLIQKHLSENEIKFIENHIPRSGYLTEDAVSDLIADKDRYILKPLDSYGASGIFLGLHMEQEEFERTVRSLTDGHYLWQEFCLPYKSPNLLLEDGALYRKSYHNLTGLYVYAGHLSGIYSRCCENELIGGQFGGRELVSLVEPA